MARDEKQLISDISQAILDFDEDAAIKAAKEIIAAGADPVKAVSAMGDALNSLGDQFQKMEVFLPEIILASDALKAGLTILEPEILKKQTNSESRPVVIIGTVKGDVHQVGKDMVSTMLLTAGYDVRDLGVDVAPSRFLEEANKFDAKVIAASALMSTTLPVQKDLIDFLEAKNVRRNYKVIVGGGVATKEWAARIGADGYSQDAIGAVQVVNQLLGRS
ncbi:MAG: cobalamin-dependent protein [Synergistaceae bacterium]|nr:cobalamin-dependent protein [Synergistaceae bacterium]